MNLLEEDIFDDDKRKQLSATFNPNFYNPFEIKHRRRTSRGQFKILENAFIDNPKPTAKFRLELATSLSMSPRGVQVWFQNRRAKAKQQQQQQQQDIREKCLQQCNDTEDLVDGLAVEQPSFELMSSGMVHSRSQSSLSSSTTYSTGNNDSLHTTRANVMQQVIYQSPLLLTPPQQQQQQLPPPHHQSEWWNDIIIDNSHQTFVPAVQEASYSLTDTTACTNKQILPEQMDVWAYIDSLDLATNQTKIDVESWLSSTKEALNDDLFAIIDNRRHSLPTNTTHIIQQQQNQSHFANWTTQQEQQATNWCFNNTLRVMAS
ncbi:unnamed protein product [Mucor hiemalis]